MKARVTYKIPLRIAVKWKVDMDTEKNRKAVLNAKALLPASVVSANIEYAEWLEFGTGPAQNNSEGELEYAISKWVRLKLGIDPGCSDDEILAYARARFDVNRKYRRGYGHMKDPRRKEFANKVDSICYSIRKYGNKPHPWFRPSIYEVWDNDSYFNSNTPSIVDIASAMAMEIHKTLISKNMIFTGSLDQSIKVEVLTPEEAQRALMQGSLMGGIHYVADDVWAMRDVQEMIAAGKKR